MRVVALRHPDEHAMTAIEVHERHGLEASAQTLRAAVAQRARFGEISAP